MEYNEGAELRANVEDIKPEGRQKGSQIAN
jgi:hypothetical protein